MSAFPPCLQALLRPQAYPHPVGVVELIETHVSWVLLTGEFAYKIKRPVRYSFVDLRSAEHRQFLCQEEIRLNRRFAPQLYLQVCPITSLHGEACVEGLGPVIEHAVKMRQFRADDELDRLLDAARIEPAELETFGSELARIHARLPQADSGQEWGRPSATRALIMKNASECSRVGGVLGGTLVLGSIHASLSARLDALMGLMAERFAAGRVRECHGDLHTRNIVRHGPGLLGFDCLEFDPALRWIDVADEIAFLLADLESRRAVLQAQAFLAGYLAESGDYQACALLPLFKAHRALVRATITALSVPQDTTGGGSHSAARRQYDTYVECADHALAPRRAVLILMSGLSGSGKTWFAQRLAPRLLGIHLRSDIERKRLSGMLPTQRSDSDVAQGLYSRAVTADVYHHLAQCAESTLAGGYPTIVDATFGERVNRARFIELAARLGVRICLVRCCAPHEVLEARIVERHLRSNDASDADLSVLAWQEEHFEPIHVQEGFTVLEASSEGGAIEELVARIAAASA